MYNKAAKIILPLLTGLIIISSCNDKKPGAAFDEILEQPPYAGITDSIKQEPENDALYFRRAVLLNTNKLPEPALVDFEKAWSLKKDERYAIGISRLLLDKNPDSAILFMNKALEVLPNSLLLQLSLARGYDAQNKTDDALKACDAILQKNPQQVDVLKMKADLLGKKGNEKEATAILEKAYQLAPFDMQLNEILALQFAETKNPRVLALCDSLIKADSLGQFAQPYYFKGIYYANINNPAKALFYFDEAIKHDYNFMDGYIEKGSLLFEMKKYPEALKVFNLSLTISPELADNYYWIGKCQEALGQKAEAKLNYQRAYGLDNSFKEAKEAAERLVN
jgi:tetratricopeptide (TPR) repeat protein